MDDTDAIRVFQQAWRVCEEIAAIRRVLDATRADTAEWLARVRQIPPLGPCVGGAPDPASITAFDALSVARTRDRSPGPSGISLRERLSPRECEIVLLVLAGQMSGHIARQLCLSPKTVETYRSRLMVKPDVDTLIALVKLAMQHGGRRFRRTSAAANVASARKRLGRLRGHA